MSLLREIQASLMEQNQDISPILLKLRFLASRLGSEPLADWVRFETEGYPTEVELPEYRLLGVTYKVDTLGYGGSGIRNAPIPTELVRREAGDQWTNYQCRQSVASIDQLMSASGKESHLNIDASNLMLILQGKIYPQHNIASVTGNVAVSAMFEIQNAVRSRLLELTIKLEKETPFAADIVIGPIKHQVQIEETQKVSQIAQQIVHGNYTHISNTGIICGLLLDITPRDTNSVVDALVEKGIPSEEAVEFSNILAEEEPESSDEPFGTKAKAWIAKSASKLADGTWKMGVSVGTKVLTEAAMKYYGFK